MVTREDFGVPLILEAQPACELRRRTDWAEPPAEGDWNLSPQTAGDELER